MKCKPNKVFILSDNGYIEISWQEFYERRSSDEFFRKKYFLHLHGILMEVPREVYKDFYRDRRRQKYLAEQSADNGEFYYDMLTTDDFNGEDILVDRTQDILEQIMEQAMLDKLREAVRLLSNDELELIQALFYDGLTEREYARKRGIYRNAVHKRKVRILNKLRKLLEV